MTEKIQYWNQLISKGISFLQEQNNDAAAAVLKKAAFDVEHTYHDSWRWGTDYWALIFYLKKIDYMDLGDKKDQIEKDIMSALVPFQKGSRDLLSTVSIRQAVEEDVDWTEARPFRNAIEDAEIFLREGRYDYAFDRIQTAFSDYIKQADLEDRARAILRSAGEIIDTINELRNFDTIKESENTDTSAQPDRQLIGKREAQFAIDLANAIVEYTDGIDGDSPR